MFSNKTLLITGGTGSFGNAVMERFLDTNIKEIRIFSRDEKKQEDIRNRYHHDKLKFYIGDVRDPNSVKNAMYGVDYVFHAAALKQVPSCEFFPDRSGEDEYSRYGKRLECRRRSGCGEGHLSLDG